MKEYVDLVNQIAEIEKKLKKDDLLPQYARNISRIRQVLEGVEITYDIPGNEKYNESRTDLDASISGDASGDLYIVDVLKPIVYLKGVVYQKGVVIVEAKK